MARTATYLLVLASAIPFFYDRYLAFSPMFANLPGRMKTIYGFKSHNIRFQDWIRNCEDVVLYEDAGLAILSCDAGRDRWNTVMGAFHQEKEIVSGDLYIYDYSTPDLPDSEALKQIKFENFSTDDFHPLGIEFEAETSTLFVANHAQSGTVIEVFKVSLKSAVASRIQTLRHDLLHSPNSIHAIGSGKLFVTNDHWMRAALSPILAQVESWFGIPGGSVVFIDIAEPSAAKVVARLPFANGITMFNSTTLAVASSSKAGVNFYTTTPEYDLQFKKLVRTPAAVDNISLDSKGRLLMAGHAFPPKVAGIARRRWQCEMRNGEVQGGEEERDACRCDAPSWVAEWSEEGGLREIFKDEAFCSSSTAVRDVKRGVGMVSGLYERGLLVFRE
ncbi:hypothetical protein BCR34DRAFT_677913 [Clohesyomyces aquaticus]|uniref:Paraoxonase n=1 Tax=Clohesyomyces aquaticus TaxID=1231657 RepID=A0A1Y1Y388_9PLEO|nr:hypothetical protein BCR34DRAFT_677913 [Clohesyomyces aquaticus]